MISEHELQTATSIETRSGWELKTIRLGRDCQSSPAWLLDQGELLLPDNDRYALTRSGPVVLSERRIETESDAWSQPVVGDEQTGKLVQRSLSPEEIEAALASCTINWDRRDGGWVVAGAAEDADRFVRETQTGVTVEAVLATWEGKLEDRQRDAISHFLCVVHAAIRFARCRIESQRACVASHAHASRLDVELPDSLASVAHIHRLLVRNVQALQNEAVAEAYLSFVAARYYLPED